jgi:hypothetical protein
MVFAWAKTPRRYPTYRPAPATRLLTCGECNGVFEISGAATAEKAGDRDLAGFGHSSLLFLDFPTIWNRSKVGSKAS